MSNTICLGASTLYYPQGGGHMWVFLNWALGLQALGCKVIWLEKVNPGKNKSKNDLTDYFLQLKERLAPFGLENSIALLSEEDELSFELQTQCIDMEKAYQSDLLINLCYDLPAKALAKFKKTALIDIDPGLLQFFLGNRVLNIAPHDIYFTIGETVGHPSARFPSAGIKWHYTPPCVAIDWWTPAMCPETSPFTTVSHWNNNEYILEKDGSYYSNDKRDGFLPFLDLPSKTSQSLELALCLGNDLSEEKMLRSKGWKIKDANVVTNSPQAYQDYIKNSKGEFSCVKPHCIRLKNAWISDRTLCYLASGKPAVVQNTGPSRFLPDAAGLFRFEDMKGAIESLEKVAGDYDNQSRMARSLAEEFFDAKKILRSVVERAL